MRLLVSQYWVGSIKFKNHCQLFNHCN